MVCRRAGRCRAWRRQAECPSTACCPHTMLSACINPSRTSRCCCLSTFKANAKLVLGDAAVPSLRRVRHPSRQWTKDEWSFHKATQFKFKRKYNKTRLKRLKDGLVSKMLSRRCRDDSSGPSIRPRATSCPAAWSSCMHANRRVSLPHR